jgi:hypothetical protein
MIAALHAIYLKGRWLGGFPGEEECYGDHIEAAIRLTQDLGYECLCFSGGATRPNLEKETEGLSEAEGAQAYASERGLLSAIDDKIILETLARDSMENVYFSSLAFFHRTGRWPDRVGVVSWNSKGLRFHLIAAGMRLGGKIHFHGVGDYTTQADLERACAAEARFDAALVDTSYLPPRYRLVDPLLRDVDEFARKRWARMPSRFSPDAEGNQLYMTAVKAAYGGQSATVLDLIDEVERLEPGDGWRSIAWPWM